MIRSRMFALLFVLLGLAGAEAEILRVPAEYLTIQSALDATAAGDTVLVSLGTYAEALSGPPHSFMLKGDVTIDTGLYERPIVDPSTLPNPLTVECLFLNSIGTPVIEDMVFRNRTPMFPREYEVPGGVTVTSAEAIIRYCVFDSTYVGLWCDSSTVTLDACRFLNNVRLAAWAHHGRFLATDCDFNGFGVDFGLVYCTSGSSFTRCRFSYSNSTDHLLYLIGRDCVMRECVIGPIAAVASQTITATLTNSVIENNVLADCQTRNALLSLGGYCNEPGLVRGNEFLRGGSPDNWPNGGGWMSISVADSGEGDCPGPLIEDNVFHDRHTNLGTCGVLFEGGPIRIRHNRFTRMESGDYGGAVTTFGTPTNHLVTDNLLYGNSGYAAYGDQTFLNVPNNWWGDPTGPYNPISNPGGQGDTVGDLVWFDPWRTDTTFFGEDAPEPPRPLPREVMMEIYPTPFNAQATLRLTVDRPKILRVELFDVLGRRVAEIWSGAVGVRKEISFDGSTLASGLYFVRAYDLMTNRPVAAVKLVCLK